MTELWFQVGVALLESVPVKEMNKWIQVSVIRTVDPSAIIDHKLVLFIGSVLQVSSREKLGIVPSKPDVSSKLVSFRIGILHAKAKLSAPLFPQWHAII